MNSNRQSIRLMTGIGIPLVVLLALVTLFVQNATRIHAASDQGNRQDLKNYQHVFVIMMENTGYDSLIGNANAPWINFAAANYGVARSYFGVTHPSQPNYIAATSGSTNGVVNDNDITIDVSNIVDQLEAHGKTWKGYMQSWMYRPMRHVCQTSWISASSTPTWRTTRFPTTPGSARTSAMTCTGAPPRLPIPATSLKCRA